MAQATHGSFVWYDHLALDTKAAIDFYTHLFGWTTQAIQQGYTTFAASQGAMAGTVAMPDKLRGMGVPPHWSANVYVDDIDASVALVTKLGGKVHTGPNEYPGVGKLATIADPQMATINLFQPENPVTVHDATKHWRVHVARARDERPRVGVGVLLEALRLEEVARLRHGADGQVPRLRQRWRRSGRGCSRGPRTSCRIRTGSTTCRSTISTRPSPGRRTGARSW